MTSIVLGSDEPTRPEPGRSSYLRIRELESANDLDIVPKIKGVKSPFPSLACEELEQKTRQAT